MAILKRVWKGESVEEIAERFGVSRQTIYRWNERAMEAVRVALRPRAGRPREK